jgi:uncharacterized protein YndB with AHSA1/START domain
VRIEKTVTIARSPHEVWEYISDPSNDPDWCEKVDSVDRPADGASRLGASYRVMHRPRPRKAAVALEVEVVEFFPPHRMGLRQVDDDGTFNVVYLLESVGAGTQLTQVDEIDWKIPKPAYPIARAMVSRDMARQFAALKNRLEST